MKEIAVKAVFERQKTGLYLFRSLTGAAELHVGITDKDGKFQSNPVFVGNYLSHRQVQWIVNETTTHTTINAVR